MFQYRRRQAPKVFAEVLPSLLFQEAHRPTWEKKKQLLWAE